LDIIQAYLGFERVVTTLPPEQVPEEIVKKKGKEKKDRANLILRGLTWFGAPIVEFYENGCSVG
jgi:hypothetical protein